MRLGTFYRSLILDKLKIRANKELVLDVGSFDGYWLSQQMQLNRKIAVDINPSSKLKDVTYIKADALNLPFKDNTFYQVFSFDVIEHIEDDKRFLMELSRVCKVNGEIVISTPNKNIRIFPSFLTNWVSNKWGHYRTKGYLDIEIKELMPKCAIYEVFYIRASFFRGLYLILRFLWGINEKITKDIVKLVANLDSRFLYGQKGYLLIKIMKIKDDVSK